MSLFVTFEGGEGSGKSTVLKQVNEILLSEGHSTLLTREPGGTPISEQIRNVILDKANTSMDPRTEALLYAASRRQHLVEKIWPALKEGKIVLCDRFLDSSLAYQGGARGLGMDEILEVNRYATEGQFPDITLFFDLDPSIGLQRIAATAGRDVTRLDLERMTLHEKVRASFQKLASLYPERYVTIDASQPLEKVVEDSLKAIKAKL